MWSQDFPTKLKKTFFFKRINYEGGKSRLFLDYFISEVPRIQSFPVCLRAPSISVECASSPTLFYWRFPLFVQSNETFAFSQTSSHFGRTIRALFSCSDMSAEKTRRQLRHRKLQRFARLRNELDFGADIFIFFSPCLPPFCFSLCLFSRILGFDKRGGHCCPGEGSAGSATNALQTGRRRATKKATAYSKATVQLLSHAKHSNALCKGWAGEELLVDLSQASHLGHTQTKLGPLPLMHRDRRSFVCAASLRVWGSAKYQD